MSNFAEVGSNNFNNPYSQVEELSEIEDVGNKHHLFYKKKFLKNALIVSIVISTVIFLTGLIIFGAHQGWFGTRILRLPCLEIFTKNYTIIAMAVGGITMVALSITAIFLKKMNKSQMNKSQQNPPEVQISPVKNKEDRISNQINLNKLTFNELVNIELQKIDNRQSAENENPEEYQQDIDPMGIYDNMDNRKKVDFDNKNAIMRICDFQNFEDLSEDLLNFEDLSNIEYRFEDLLI
ncbi:MAG: hypothetical protein R3E91_01570 [Chlamydiales bacterium]